MTYGSNGDCAGRDRFGRVIDQRRTNAAATTDLDPFHFNESWQALDERFHVTSDKRQVASDVHVQYLWDIRYIDAPVLRWRDADANPATGLEETLYYASDANMNVTALVDASSGNVVERYVYTPYGEATVLHANWSPVTNNESAVANDILFTGHPLDFETRLYLARLRYDHPTLGGWLQRDHAGYSQSMCLYEYADSQPTVARDSFGLASSRSELSLEVKQKEWSGASIELGYGGPQVGLVPSPGLGNDLNVYLNQLYHRVSTSIEMNEEHRSQSEWFASLIVAVSASEPQPWIICPKYGWTLSVRNLCCESGLVRVTVRSFGGSMARVHGPASGLVSVLLGAERVLSPDASLAITYPAGSGSERILPPIASWSSRAWIRVSVACVASGPVYA